MIVVTEKSLFPALAKEQEQEQERKKKKGKERRKESDVGLKDYIFFPLLEIHKTILSFFHGF